MSPELIALIIKGGHAVAELVAGGADEKAIEAIAKRAVRSAIDAALDEARALVAAGELRMAFDDLADGAADVMREWEDARRRGHERIDDEARSRIELTEVAPKDGQ